MMTNAVRDGGLREDSTKLFSMLVHPRTSQKYDKEVLAKGWDQPLQAALDSEREHFKKLHDALEKKADLLRDATSAEVEISEVDKEVTQLLDSSPLQVQQVWDNLNIRSKHRYERKGDDYSKYYLELGV